MNRVICLLLGGVIAFIVIHVGPEMSPGEAGDTVINWLLVAILDALIIIGIRQEERTQ